MPCYMLFGRAVSGEISPSAFLNGSRSTGMAPATRFSRWKKQNILAEINCFLNQLDRKRENKNENPSSFCIDSQSVKLSPMIFENRGMDAHKKVNGRKRQLLVDTGGRIWFAHVHAANEPDGTAALGLSADILCQNQCLQKIYGDQAASAVRL
jgi:hypothetical protein